MGLGMHHAHIRSCNKSFRDLSWRRCWPIALSSDEMRKVQNLNAHGAGCSAARLIRGADGELRRWQCKEAEVGMQQLKPTQVAAGCKSQHVQRGRQHAAMAGLLAAIWGHATPGKRSGRRQHDQGAPTRRSAARASFHLAVGPHVHHARWLPGGGPPSGRQGVHDGH